MRIIELVCMKHRSCQMHCMRRTLGPSALCAEPQRTCHEAPGTPAAHSCLDARRRARLHEGDDLCLSALPHIVGQGLHGQYIAHLRLQH